MLAYGRQKPTFSHFVTRIFEKILAEQLTHFIRYLLYPTERRHERKSVPPVSFQSLRVIGSDQQVPPTIRSSRNN